jgi:aminomethyltransferase
MTKLYPGLYATPFHPRTAAHNIYNAWTERGMFTVPQNFGNAAREALAARFSAVLADISPWGRLRVHGEGAARLLSSATKAEIETLAAGASRDVFWTADGGGVRGVGIVSRFGEENFLLGAADTDKDWFAGVAPRFGAKLRDERAEKGVLLLAGPYAGAILDAAGLPLAAHLTPHTHAIYDWNGISVTVARRPALRGFELSVARDDGLVLFDRLFAAGRVFALTLIGQEALELLFLEAGVPLAGLDFTPAREPMDRAPDPASLGLVAASNDGKVLAGVEWDGTNAAPFAPLYRGALEVGRSLRSDYSPALGRTIALANLAPNHAAPGTELTLFPANAARGEGSTARVVALPFLPL